MVSNERIVFCLKLWIKELHERKKQDSATTWVITTVEREVLTGEYCSEEEYDRFKNLHSKVKEICRYCKKKLKIYTQSGDLSSEIVLGVCNKCTREMLQ